MPIPEQLRAQDPPHPRRPSLLYPRLTIPAGRATMESTTYPLSRVGTQIKISYVTQLPLEIYKIAKWILLLPLLHRIFHQHKLSIHAPITLFLYYNTTSKNEDTNLFAIITRATRYRKEGSRSTNDRTQSSFRANERFSIHTTMLPIPTDLQMYKYRLRIPPTLSACMILAHGKCTEESRPIEKS